MSVAPRTGSGRGQLGRLRLGSRVGVGGKPVQIVEEIVHQLEQRHGGRGSIAFLEGHAESFKPPQGPDTVKQEAADLDGNDIYARNMDPVLVRQQVGMVFQQPNPFSMSIYDNVAFGLRLNRYKGDLDEKVERYNPITDAGKDVNAGAAGLDVRGLMGVGPDPDDERVDEVVLRRVAAFGGGLPIEAGGAVLGAGLESPTAFATVQFAPGQRSALAVSKDGETFWLLSGRDPDTNLPRQASVIETP